MLPRDFQKLFVDKSVHLAYFLTYGKKLSAGWLGGNAPKYFDDRADLLKKGKTLYQFFMTVPFGDDSASVFISHTFDAYNDHNKYPDCNI